MADVREIPVEDLINQTLSDAGLGKRFSLVLQSERAAVAAFILTQVYVMRCLPDLGLSWPSMDEMTQVVGLQIASIVRDFRLSADEALVLAYYLRQFRGEKDAAVRQKTLHDARRCLVL